MPPFIPNAPRGYWGISELPRKIPERKSQNIAIVYTLRPAMRTLWEAKSAPNDKYSPSCTVSRAQMPRLGMQGGIYECTRWRILGVFSPKRCTARKAE